MSNPNRDKIMDATVSNSKIFANPIDQYSGTKGRKIPSEKGMNNHSRTVHLGNVKEEIENEEEEEEVNIEVSLLLCSVDTSNTDSGAGQYILFFVE